MIRSHPKRYLDGPWFRNGHGLWCPACGELIGVGEDEYMIPEICRTCGFPDFEDGPGYFTDED